MTWKKKSISDFKYFRGKQTKIIWCFLSVGTQISIFKFSLSVYFKKYSKSDIHFSLTPQVPNRKKCYTFIRGVTHCLKSVTHFSESVTLFRKSVTLFQKSVTHFSKKCYTFFKKVLHFFEKVLHIFGKVLHFR